MPDPETCPLVTSIVSTILSSLFFLITIFPDSASTLSLKFKTIFASIATAVALCAGTVLVKKGLPVSCDVKLKAVVDEIPAYEFPFASSNAVESISM